MPNNYKVEKSAHLHHANYFITKDGRVIANINDSMGVTEAKVYAEIIAKACNGHKQIMGALIELFEDWQSRLPDSSTKKEESYAQQLQCKAIAAIIENGGKI